MTVDVVLFPLVALVFVYCFFQCMRLMFFDNESKGNVLLVIKKSSKYYVLAIAAFILAKIASVLLQSLTI